MKEKLRKLAFVSLAASPLATFAQEASVTIPESGVDIEGYISSGITEMGSVVAVALGGFVCFLLVKKAMGWIRRAF